LPEVAIFASVCNALNHDVTTLPPESGEFNQTVVNKENVDESALKKPAVGGLDGLDVTNPNLNRIELAPSLPELPELPDVPLDPEEPEPDVPDVPDEPEPEVPDVPLDPEVPEEPAPPVPPPVDEVPEEPDVPEVLSKLDFHAEPLQIQSLPAYE
jgi:hypothetical protein